MMSNNKRINKIFCIELKPLTIDEINNLNGDNKTVLIEDRHQV